MISFNSIQPEPMPALDLSAILDVLQQLEPIFHAAYPDANETDFERLVAPDFWEIGASGKIYTRDFALSILKNRASTPDPSTWLTSDYQITQAGQDVFLLTYTLQQPNRITRRLTVWQQSSNSWQAIYHQGTVVLD
jgi:hypothetical protein